MARRFRSRVRAVHAREGDEIGPGVDYRDIQCPVVLLGLRPDRGDRSLSDPAPPEQPIAPINLPSSIKGMPPREAMMSSSDTDI